MSWIDRIREAAYTSPSGIRFTPKFENVSQGFEKKATAFDFPGVSGTYIQDLGATGRRYPLRWFFSGADHDLEATAFLDALAERGTGVLEHPLYGIRDVVPFGEIKRRDDLKTAANQSIIEVSFWATIGSIYPTDQTNPASGVLAALEDYNAASSEQYVILVNVDTVSDRTDVKGTYTRLLDIAKVGLDTVASTQEDVEKQFNAINASINNGIDILVGEPLTLAFQTALLLQAPARAISDIRARLDAYKNLADSIISGDGAVSSSENKNDFFVSDLYSSGYMSGSVLSTVNSQFLTKTEAVEAADFILTQFDELTVWRDDNFESVGDIDTGESYQALQTAVATAAGFLVEISFTLKQERSLTLDRARNFVELVAELYGETDAQYDFFINSNNLTGSEILEIPAGRTVVYYV